MKQPTREQGGALMISMLIIVVFAGIVASGNLLSSSQILLTSRSADLDSLQTTAEGLVDFAYGKWKDSMKANSGPITTAQASALVASGSRPALPAGMQYDSFVVSALDVQGVPAATAGKTATLSQNPKGWQANSYIYSARVVLSTTNKRFPVSVTMEGIFRQDLVPPVGGLFYCEGDFELYKPAPMVIGGNVHTNANGYVTTSATTVTDKLRFLSTSNISYVGDYSHTAAPFGAAWSSSNGTTDVQAPIYDRGFASQVSKADKLEGIGMGTASEFNTKDTNHNNDGNHELIEPPTGDADPPGIANSRLSNNAGLVIEISGLLDKTKAVTLSGGSYVGGNVKITPQKGTVLTTAKATSIIAALSNAESVTTYTTVTTTDSKGKKTTTSVPSTTIQQRTMFDAREGSDVLVSDIDVGTLAPVLNTLSGFNDIIYVNNTASTSNSKGIRLDNGGVLPTDGLTVSTAGGMYVIGDYNTGTTTSSTAVPTNTSASLTATLASTTADYTTKPAALVADAVMFLSNSWSDDNDIKTYDKRPASNTTVNTAVIAGYIPSGWDNPDSSAINYGYSGGANNFPRMLEDWGGKALTFNGAFVQLYQSQMFIGKWDTGDIYRPPNRRWNFDRLLLERVIPGIPAASAFTRGFVRPL